MNIIDEFKILIGGYYGIEEMDEYLVKEYVLKEIETYIKNFLELHPIKEDIQEIVKQVEVLPLKRKLQDSLLTLQKINGPLELKLLIINRLNEIKNEDTK